ncbi:MAG: GAF domain-containing sensor histidine kinase [Anaerolineae bacterium]
MTSAGTVNSSEHNALIAQYQERLRRYERIIEISQQLNSMLDHTTLLRRIILAAHELTDTEAVSILLIDPVTGELRFETASNATTINQMQDIIVPLEGSIAGWVVTHGEGRVIENVPQDPSFYKNVDDELEFTTRNMLAVPLRTHNKVIGALEAINKRGGERFTDEDVRILNTLAGQAAIAIENSRLFQQSDFMSEMVHELRTPLAAIKTSVSLLLRPDLPNEKRSDIVETMQGETDRLIRLTSDFLDLARLESGRARLDMSPFDLGKLVQESIEVVETQAGARGIGIERNLGAYQVTADRGKIKQVLLNLLTNAIKYNREGGTVTISSYPNNRYEAPFIELSVADTGPGISKENQKQMFQKFYRVAETANSVQGTGLGLAIAKHIIEGHGGNIWLESEPGYGSTFFITLPEAL